MDKQPFWLARNKDGTHVLWRGTDRPIWHKTGEYWSGTRQRRGRSRDFSFNCFFVTVIPDVRAFGLARALPRGVCVQVDLSLARLLGTCERHALYIPPPGARKRRQKKKKTR